MWQSNTGLDTKKTLPVPLCLLLSTQGRCRQVRKITPCCRLLKLCMQVLQPLQGHFKCPWLAPSFISSWPVSKTSCPPFPRKLQSTVGRIKASTILPEISLPLCLLTFVSHPQPSPLRQNHRDSPVDMRSTIGPRSWSCQ